jgi:hypothetical protein
MKKSIFVAIIMLLLTINPVFANENENESIINTKHIIGATGGIQNSKGDYDIGYCAEMYYQY